MISEVIQETGVQRYTLLWWENKGLLKPERIANPYTPGQEDRHYSEDDIVRIKVLKILATQVGKDFCIGLLVETIKKDKVLLKKLEELFIEAKKTP